MPPFHPAKKANLEVSTRSPKSDSGLKYKYFLIDRRPDTAPLPTQHKVPLAPFILFPALPES